MSRRIEVELTSQRDDGTWTWRAAGAKQPKGTLDGGLLYTGAAIGDVCRAEADFEIDGIFVTAVLPPKGRSGRPEDERIEIKGAEQKFEAVTTQLAKKGRSQKRKGGKRRDSKNQDRDSDSRSRRPRKEGEDRRGRQSKPENSEPAKPKPKKLKPGRKHRKEFIDALPEEQRVVADQVARGGIAAVRKEIETQNAKATEEGNEAVRSDGLIELAESLLPQLKVAEWRDRADAALSTIDEVDIRDLRTVLVAAEDFARTDESRELTEKIRKGLAVRVEKEQSKWQDEIRTALKEERVVRALRLSSRPPKAGSPLPPDIAETLTSQASEALGGDVTQQRLGIVLEAIAFSPIRPYIALAQIPAAPNKELLEVITKVADRIPEIAKQFGIEPVAKTRGKRKGRKKPSPSKSDSEAVTENADNAQEDASESSAPASSTVELEGAADTDAQTSDAEAVERGPEDHGSTQDDEQREEASEPSAVDSSAAEVGAATEIGTQPDDEETAEQTEI